VLAGLSSIELWRWGRRSRFLAFPRPLCHVYSSTAQTSAGLPIRAGGAFASSPRFVAEES
jgi:hypothetical protein